MGKKKLEEQAKAEEREYQRARRKEIAEMAAELGEEEKPKKKLFKCELCKKKFKSEKQLENHKKSKLHKKNLQKQSRALSPDIPPVSTEEVFFDDIGSLAEPQITMSKKMRKKLAKKQKKTNAVNNPY